MECDIIVSRNLNFTGRDWVLLSKSTVNINLRLSATWTQVVLTVCVRHLEHSEKSTDHGKNGTTTP